MGQGEDFRSRSRYAVSARGFGLERASGRRSAARGQPVLSWVAAIGLVRASVEQKNLALLMTAVILFFIAFFFLQFHCLDCGATGWLLRSWAHACPAVVARRRSQAVRRFRGPGLKLQLAAWFIFLTAAFILGAVGLGSRR